MENNISPKLKEILTGDSYFSQPFLSTFFINIKRLPWQEEELRSIDQALSAYEQIEIDYQLDQLLKLHNDFLFSFAVSKAENSQLTLLAADEIYRLITGRKDIAPFKALSEKLDKGARLNQKDHDRLEYYNIVQTFQSLAKKKVSLNDLSPDFIADLHRQLTLGLDIFTDKLPGFEPYHSGCFRDDDKTRVADFKPAPPGEIKDSLIELLAWIKKNPSAINVFIFHAALYSLHPFKNGNKRVCRVLEHLILRDIAYNQNNLYNLSYYYYQQKDRYYKNLINSLYKHSFNPFVAFASEALYFSALGVIKGVLERKKQEFINNSNLGLPAIKLLKSLVKNGELKFSRFYALSKRKVSRQTFINYLNEALDQQIIIKREQGRNTYYSVAGNYLEVDILKEKLKIAREKLNYLPPDLISYL